MSLKGEPASLQLPRSCHFGSLAHPAVSFSLSRGRGGRRGSKYLDDKARTRIVASQEPAEIGGNTGGAEHPLSAVEKIHQRFRRHPLLLNQVQHHAGIEVANWYSGSSSGVTQAGL